MTICLEKYNLMIILDTDTMYIRREYPVWRSLLRQSCSNSNILLIRFSIIKVTVCCADLQRQLEAGTERLTQLNEDKAKLVSHSPSRRYTMSIICA